MRRLIASSLAALMLTLGVPLIGAANGATANVVGQVVDASGRGSNATKVELVLNGATVGTTTTSFGGSFMFTGVVPGTYVIRAMVRGRQTGVQISLAAGQSAPVVVVLPSMVTVGAQLQLATFIGNLATTLAGATAATVATEVIEEAAADADQDLILDAIENNTIVTVLVNALSQATGTLTADQRAAVGAVLGDIIASLPPAASAELQQQLDVVLDQQNASGQGILVGIVIPTAPKPNGNPTNGSPTI